MTRPLDVETRAYERNYEGYIAQLDDDDPQVRRFGARDLAGYAEAAPSLLSHLRSETDVGVMKAILGSLVQIGGNEVITGLIPFLSIENAALRNMVFDALGRFGGELVVHLEEMLLNQDADIRIFAANLIAHLPEADSLKLFKETIERDDHVNVIATVIDHLAEIGTPEIVPAVEKAKQRFANEPFIQFAADIAIRRIKG